MNASLNNRLMIIIIITAYLFTTKYRSLLRPDAVVKNDNNIHSSNNYSQAFLNIRCKFNP